MKVTRQTLVPVGALAAIVGGACWAVKAAGILITGVQPPVIYDVAPLFFPVTVLGLYSLLDAPRSGSATSGLVLACCAELAALILVVGLLVGPPEWSPNGNTVTVLTPFTAVASLATLVGLCLLGVVVRRTHALTGWWATLPVLPRWMSASSRTSGLDQGGEAVAQRRRALPGRSRGPARLTSGPIVGPAAGRAQPLRRLWTAPCCSPARCGLSTPPTLT